MTGERWRTIPSAPAFAISDLGRVKRVRGSTPEAKAAIGKPKKPTLSAEGYCIVGLWSDGRTVTFQVHRLVCDAFHGPAPSRRHQAAHGNGDKTDNRATNLRWATPRENASDKERHGTVVRGEAHPFSKLTDAAVLEIRGAPNGQCGRLAAKYGVLRTHVSRLRSKTRGDWSHVPFPSESPSKGQAE
jgi:hypothetical protein